MGGGGGRLLSGWVSRWVEGGGWSQKIRGKSESRMHACLSFREITSTNHLSFVGLHFWSRLLLCLLVLVKKKKQKARKSCVFFFKKSKKKKKNGHFCFVTSFCASDFGRLVDQLSGR